MENRGHCAYCNSEIAESSTISCPRCEVPYHAECWQENRGRCAIFACEPMRVLSTSPPPSPVFAGRRFSIQDVMHFALIAATLYFVVTVGYIFLGDYPGSDIGVQRVKDLAPPPLDSDVPDEVVRQKAIEGLRRVQNKIAMEQQAEIDRAMDIEGLKRYDRAWAIREMLLRNNPRH